MAPELVPFGVLPLLAVALVTNAVADPVPVTIAAIAPVSDLVPFDASTLLAVAGRASRFTFLASLSLGSPLSSV